ncbi:MAG: hypothetical protein AAF571_05940 [Verrucomicrobiota bacterium]
MRGLFVILFSSLLVSSVIGMTLQPSHVWVQVAKASHSCADGKCCSETTQSPSERHTPCPCGPCDIATPPLASPLILPDATQQLKKTVIPSERLLTAPIIFSSLNWSPPVPPPQH